ncbi:MAG: hypothetical protein HY875_17390 [Chloroflexi bacterium]|nr:hypothetical protein [Chloroflexota bacterium]
MTRRVSRGRLIATAVAAGALVAGVVVVGASRGGSSARGDGGHSVVVPNIAGDSAPGPLGLQCGVERWDVKTLSDTPAVFVNYTPVDTTVDALRAMAAPAIGDHTPRISPLEFTTYRVTARLVEMKREDDRDIHLVIADPSDVTHTMIVELPDVACEGPNRSAKKTEMQAARQAFEAACGGPTTSFKALTGTATFVGVGFWDEIHGQRGVAPNGIELHPILDVSGISCGGSGATPTATSPSATCGGSTGDIIALDKVAETVTVNAQGPMTGWYVISQAGNQRFDFPADYVGTGNVVISSDVPAFAGTQATLWWSASPVWNNSSNDDALLFDCNDVQRDFFEDGM